MAEVIVVIGLLIFLYAIFVFFKMGDHDFSFKPIVDMDYTNYRLDIIIFLLAAIFLVLFGALWK